ncbi:DUF2142 domain-containing protein [Agreia sp. COWG]|uniref:DUF2142 domain-containing protein n=1 Tax=Agreia sp. COWG TaxID=2773266 RepID=UPI00192974AE|nr:DUF2142 domain-containing protein [Agreia sp. COWG]
MFVISWLSLAVMAILWAVTSPIGASMDEPSHYIKAASVVRGQLVGEPGARAQDRVVTVPETVALTFNVHCLAFRADVTADCIQPFGSASKDVEVTTAAGLYNPTYYVLVGWPSLLDVGGSALYFMRFASAILCSLFFAISITFLSRLPRPTLPVLAAIAVITPTTVFLSGSVNPNAFEIATTAAFFAGLLYAVSTVHTRSSRLWTAAALAVSGALLAHARGLSMLWLGIAVVVVAISVGVGHFVRVMVRPPFVIAVALVTVSLVLAGIWTLKTNSLPAVGEYPGAGSTFGEGFLTMLSSTVDYMRQAVGVFGWLDSFAPTWVLVMYYALLCVVVVYGLLFARPSRSWAALWVALASFLFVPPLVQASTVTVSGYVWQGRYTLPLIVILVVMAAVVGSTRFAELPWRDAKRVVIFVLVVTSLGQLVSAVTNLKRYVVGASASWGEYFSAPRWSPPFFNAPAWFVVCGIVVVMYLGAGLAVTLLRDKKKVTA